MSLNTTYTKILTDEDLMETVSHGNSSYPFQYYYEDLALFDFNCIDWHWHTELEFVYIESGTVTVWIGEKQFEIIEGNGIFINSKVLHRFYSPANALIPNFVFMPSFISASDSLIYQKYVLPIISSSLSFVIFHKEVPWQARVLSVMQQIISAQSGHPGGDGHGTAETAGQLDEQLSAGLVVLVHVGLQLTVHASVLIQPFSAHGVADGLHTGQDQAHAVFCSLQQKVGSLGVKVGGLQPAEQGSAAHGTLDDAVGNFYISDLERSK